ncbi:45647_t:CDS:1, partial [Gigaspora margarita]
EDAPKLPSYQTGEEVYWNNGEDVRYAYSKLTPDELLLEEDSKTFLDSGLTNNTQITEETQNLFDIC